MEMQDLAMTVLTLELVVQQLPLPLPICLRQIAMENIGSQGQDRNALDHSPKQRPSVRLCPRQP